MSAEVAAVSTRSLSSCHSGVSGVTHRPDGYTMTSPPHQADSSCLASSAQSAQLPSRLIGTLRVFASGKRLHIFHRGRRAVVHPDAKWRNVILVHTPIHGRWLNQIGVYFSIVLRQLITPSDFATLLSLHRDLMAFQRRYQRASKTSKWTITRLDLHVLLVKLSSHTAPPHKPQPVNTSPSLQLAVLRQSGRRRACHRQGRGGGASAPHSVPVPGDSGCGRGNLKAG